MPLYDTASDWQSGNIAVHGPGGISFGGTEIDVETLIETVLE